MPKLKTNRSAAKRFRVTASGKIKRNKAGKRHLRQSALVHPGDAKRMAKLLGM